MILIVLAVIGVVGVPFALAVARADDVNAWLWALPQRLRGRGWGLLLVPVAVCYAVMARHDPALAGLAILLAVLLLVFAPRAARKAVPFAMLLLGGYLLRQLVSSYRGDNIVRGFMDQPLYNTWSGYLVPAVLGLFAAGLWLLVRVEAPGAERSGRWPPGGATARAAASIPPKASCCCRSRCWPWNCSGRTTGSARMRWSSRRPRS
jgi:hypothetical protein